MQNIAIADFKLKEKLRKAENLILNLFINQYQHKSSSKNFNFYFQQSK